MEEENETLNTLTQTLNELLEDPYSIQLQRKHIQLNRTARLDVDQAQQLCVQNIAAPDEVWLPFLTKQREQLDITDGEGVKSLLELFEKAEKDYFSIDIVLLHMQFLVELGAVEDSAVTKDDIRGELRRLAKYGTLHLIRGNEPWKFMRDWEMEMISASEGSRRQVLINQLDMLHIERLEQPHEAHGETLDLYSNFVSTFRPDKAYEKALVDATEAKQEAVKIFSRRERFETGSPDWNAYISFERKKINLSIIKGVFERAIADAAAKLWVADGLDEKLKADLVSYWDAYATVLRGEGEGEERELLERAIRSVPWSGRIWATYMRALESVSEDVSEAFQKAISIKAVTKDVEACVDVVLAKASAERRRIDEGIEDGLTESIMALETGIQLVRSASKIGDTKLRLERFMSELCLNAVVEPLLDMAVELWKSASTHYKNNYMAWINYAEILAKASRAHEARKTFSDAAQKFQMDWPEAIWEAWMRFEGLNGRLEDEEMASQTIAVAREKIEKKRQKDAEKESLAYQKYMATYAIPSTSFAVAAPPESNTMDVDTTTPESSNTKRKLRDQSAEPASKKAKTDESSLKRDRENSTIFVGNLPPTASEDGLKDLFRDCGDIREIKITSLSNHETPNILVATVEFISKDSIPAALTKDKKRIRGSDNELSVYLAWQSTLYVTNFPERTDDTQIRHLFEKYGVIFETRWPSKKFKATRRFCYVQFANPGSAQAALELHNTELEPGHPLNVFISNPDRKKDRTDVGADAREVYVAGLAKSTTKEDLEGVFKTYGAIKDIRLALDEGGTVKGFAFIEYQDEDSAQKALGANNHELKRRRLAVTIADSRAHAKQKGPTASGKSRRNEKLDRSVRIIGLPRGVQDGLLQQLLERHAQVERLTVDLEALEAMVELTSPTEAGKLLLINEPILYDGIPLQIVESDAPPSKISSKSNASLPATAGFVPRAAAGRRSKPGLGVSAKKSQPSNGQSPSTPTFVAASAIPSKTDGKGLGQDAFRGMLKKSK